MLPAKDPLICFIDSEEDFEEVATYQTKLQLSCIYFKYFSVILCFISSNYIGFFCCFCVCVWGGGGGGGVERG